MASDACDILTYSLNFKVSRSSLSILARDIGEEKIQKENPLEYWNIQ